jgi:hypothetical protein
VATAGGHYIIPERKRNPTAYTIQPNKKMQLHVLCWGPTQTSPTATATATAALLSSPHLPIFLLSFPQFVPTALHGCWPEEPRRFWLLHRLPSPSSLPPLARRTVPPRPRPIPIPRRRQGSREVNGNGVELPAASATLASRLPPSVCCCVVGPLLLLSGGLSTYRPQLWSVAFALQCSAGTNNRRIRGKREEDDDRLLLLLPLRRPCSSAQVQDCSALPKRRAARCHLHLQGNPLVNVCFTIFIPGATSRGICHM